MANSISRLTAESQQDIEIMVKDIHTETASNGNPYQKLTVQDMEGRGATFLNFNAPINIDPPAVCRMLVNVSSFNGSPSIRILRSEVKTDADISGYYPKPAVDEKESFAEVNSYYKKLRDPGLRMLTGYVLSRDPAKFRTNPLTPTGAYARQCGIMEATLNLLRLVDTAIPMFHLDADLAIASALLYYVGNIDLVTDGYMPTEDDVLTGESNAIQRMVVEENFRLQEKNGGAPVLAKRQLNLLLHVLTSRYDDVRSAIPEAVVLHDLNTLVRKTDEVNIILKDAESGNIVSVGWKQKYFKM